jgi:hypothetical protein
VEYAATVWVSQGHFWNSSAIIKRFIRLSDSFSASFAKFLLLSQFSSICITLTFANFLFCLVFVLAWAWDALNRSSLRTHFVLSPIQFLQWKSGRTWKTSVQKTPNLIAPWTNIWVGLFAVISLSLLDRLSMRFAHDLLNVIIRGAWVCLYASRYKITRSSRDRVLWSFVRSWIPLIVFTWTWWNCLIQWLPLRVADDAFRRIFAKNHNLSFFIILARPWRNPFLAQLSR